MNIYFTSDTHYGHHNIIRYSNRPFQNTDEMDEALITNWNAVVTAEDTVYHLGDVSFHRDQTKTKRILDRLNGTKILIFGNHDRDLKKHQDLRGAFARCHDYLEVTHENQHLVMCHYPMITWNKSHRGSWMLHGHCHGSLKYPFEAKIHDVGVDPNGHKPLSFAELTKIMSKKTSTVVDHHGM